MTGPMFDLNVEQLDDGTIRLQQNDYAGEAAIIDLHPCQLRHVAQREGLLAPAPAVAWPRGFGRRLERLRGDLGYLASDIWLDEIIERISDGLAYRIALTAALDTLDDLLLDAGILPDADGERNEISPAISVTASETPKRGRPATGEAMTNSERQRAHRARQAGKEPESLSLDLEEATA